MAILVQLQRAGWFGISLLVLVVSVAMPLGAISETPILQPGSGWSGPTPEPDPVGAGFGADAKAIARWNVVPFQTLDCYFEIGVVAFHINGIERVDFAVDDGPWVSVTEMKINPRTGVEEYWANLDCSVFPDGPIEIRAIVYPHIGIPRLLQGPIDGGAEFERGEHSMFLSSNANGTLPAIVRYVSNAGDDVTGDGSLARPFASIMRAAHAIQSASPEPNADGGTIYLAPGDHRLGTYAPPLVRTEHRWLTIEPQPGADRSHVRIIGSDRDGLRTKLVRLKSLQLVPPPPVEGGHWVLLSSNGPLDDYIWLDSCSLRGPGRGINGRWGSGFTDFFITDCYVTDCRDGPVGSIVRNVRIENIGSDAFTNAKLVVNSSVTGIDPGGTSFHADVIQYSSGGAVMENRIAYNVFARSSAGQGVFAGDNMAIKDIALINCDISNQEGQGTVARVFQFAGPTEHLYVRDSAFRGGTSLRYDMNFSAHNIVIENTWFSNPLGIHSGITFR